MAVSDLGTPGTGPSGNYQRCTPEGPSSTGSRSNWSFLKLRDEGWRFHLWENCNLGDAQLVAAARCERIYRQLKRGGLRFHHGSVASFIQRETAAAICIHANAPHPDGRQLNFWKMTGGGNRWRIHPALVSYAASYAASRFWSISVSFSLLSETPPLIGSGPARPNLPSPPLPLAPLTGSPD